ncbi:hypothetical protein UB23_20505 [Pseudomonas sp. ES3-33]|nr:hypothetical protein UB23_20505 [Pseudomonas sp. ES3-33]
MTIASMKIEISNLDQSVTAFIVLPLVQLLPDWSLLGGWLQAVRTWIDHLVESFTARGERLL